MNDGGGPLSARPRASLPESPGSCSRRDGLGDTDHLKIQVGRSCGRSPEVRRASFVPSVQIV
jgi:hypothetical protein